MTRARKAVMAVAVLASATMTPMAQACPPDEDGCGIPSSGPVTREPERPWSAAEAYRQMTARPNANRKRALVETSILLVGETVRYWYLQFALRGRERIPGVRERLSLDLFDYDANPFLVNSVAHSGSGFLLHLLGRSNDLSLGESALLGVVGSSLWEMVLEFRDYYSVNDIIVTPGAGIPLGEFFHWLNRDLAERAKSSKTARVFAWTVGQPYTLHAALDGGRSRPLTEAEDLSSHLRWSGRFRIGETEIDDGRTRRSAELLAGGIAFEGELVALPSYLRERSYRISFFEGNLSSLRAAIESDGSASNADVDVDTMLVGHHMQSFEGDRGRALTFGSSIGYRFRRYKSQAWSDALSVVHLPGLAARGSYSSGGRSLHLTAGTSVDFGAIGATSSQTWKLQNPDEWGNSSIQKDDYFLGWGWSARVSALLELGPVSVDGELQYSSYGSHEGLDTMEELIRDAPEAHRSLLQLRSSLRVALPLGLYGGLELESHASRSELGDTRGSQEALLYSAQFGASL